MLYAERKDAHCANFHSQVRQMASSCIDALKLPPIFTIKPLAMDRPSPELSPDRETSAI